MKPRISILDRKFVYRNSSQTDVRATFERIRKEQQSNVTPIAKVKAK